MLTKVTQSYDCFQLTHSFENLCFLSFLSYFNLLLHYFITSYFIYTFNMFNILRRVVAGPKNRTVQNQYDLDLTYITDRIIAMAFPATGIEKTYRNSIQDVVKFLNQRHGDHYLVINSSNRSYNYQYFNYQVLQFFWADHQAPPLTMLFELANKIQVFFSDNPQNIVAVHCNHGKGRTGTAIISYLLFNKQFQTVKEALNFYNAKRFSDVKYAVDQPCQLRYLNFFQAIHQMSIKQLDIELIAFKLTNASIKGLQDDRDLRLRITETRTEHVIYQSVQLSDKDKKVSNNRPLVNDIFIQVYEQSWKGQKQLVRINFNLFFLRKSKNQQQKAKKYGIIFRSQQIKVNSSQKPFKLILQFEQFCKCHKHNHRHKHLESQCMCSVKRLRQQAYWDNMILIIQKNRKRLEQLNKKNCKIQENYSKVQNNKRQEFGKDLLDQQQFNIKVDQLQSIPPTGDKTEKPINQKSYKHYQQGQQNMKLQQSDKTDLKLDKVGKNLQCLQYKGFNEISYDQKKSKLQQGDEFISYYQTKII